MSALEPCSGCGWMVEGGTQGCRARFEELLARDFSDARFFAVHRLFVDTYCLQHPDDYCASVKSLAAHLVGLGLILDGQTSSATGAAALRDWLNGSRTLAKPSLPAHRGAITLADVAAIDEPDAWREAVRRWAESTWQAYGALHPLARDWAAEARQSVRPAGPGGGRR